MILQFHFFLNETVMLIPAMAISVSKLSVGLSTIRVFTVFHPMSKVSVVVAPTREIGILEGGTFPFLYVRFLPGDTKAGAGTEMVTSGLSDFYPRGIRVGTIARMGRMKSDFFLQAWVKPAAGFSSFDEVLIGR